MFIYDKEHMLQFTSYISYTIKMESIFIHGKKISQNTHKNY